MVPNRDTKAQADLRRRLSSPSCSSTTDFFISKSDKNLSEYIFCDAAFRPVLGQVFYFAHKTIDLSGVWRDERIRRLATWNLQVDRTEEEDTGHISRLPNIKGAPFRS